MPGEMRTMFKKSPIMPVAYAILGATLVALICLPSMSAPRNVTNTTTVS
ncbi:MULTISPECIES: hypothetical protein [unclassified Streptomyces]|nr:hypothetical protein [Streptomyces sp. NBC_01237]WRZ75004.1 hypothetical protein OG251_27190 [Streptomyces sp. NBC_01237]